jgi:hypothetical protein
MPGSTFGQGVLCRVQGIGEPLGSGTGAEGFGLRVGGGPAGKADGFECGRNAGVMAVTVGVDLGGAGKDDAARGVAQALGKGIAFAHGAQVVHQVGQVTVKDCAGVGVGDW